MNPIIQDIVYGKGNSMQIEYLAEKGGMNEEEKRVFRLLHEGQTELFIQEETGLSRKPFKKVEAAVRAKLTVAIFDCIRDSMEMHK